MFVSFVGSSRMPERSEVSMILQNRSAIVTGAGRGIGRGIAMGLAREGAKVMVVDIDREGLRRTVQDIQGAGLQAEGMTVDLADHAQIIQMVERSVNQFGRLDILVNNAGVLKTIPLLELEVEEWDRELAVNLRAVFLTSKYAGRVMVKQKSGRIINISSTAGKIGAPGQGAYCAAKSGVIGLTQVLAIELGPHGVTVNALCPGNTDTEMMRTVLTFRAKSRGQTFDELAEGILAKTPLGRFGRPEDIAQTVVFLASPASSYITGQAINVCGGRTANMS
jgi:NAD(P)-dependent dehydrogenase (short-subunit alcohol dehydrogenase family)